MRTLIYLIALAGFVFAAPPSEARPHRQHIQAHYTHHHAHRVRPAQERYSPFVFDHQATDIAPSYAKRTGGRHLVRTGTSRRITTRQYVTQDRGTADFSSRPRDCYGIQWCGCWLRHHFNMASTALNLARNWAGVGSHATIDSGNVIVWNHHVGLYNGVRQGRSGTEVLLTSGNDGGAVRTRWFSVRALGGAIAYRRV